MRIDIHNYEAFFLDYKEGNLDVDQEKELFAFLEEYPQLKAELEGFEPVMLEAEVAQLDKTIFKKNEPGNEVLIGYVENIVGAKDRAEIEGLAIQNVSFARELSLYKSTVAEADLSIKFPGKSKLKRRGVVIYLQSNPMYFRVAAALLLLLGLFLLVAKLNTNETGSESKPVLAVETNKGTNKNEGKNEILSAQQGSKTVAVNSPSKGVKSIPNNISLAPQQSAKNDLAVNENETPAMSNTIAVNSHTVLVNNETSRKDERDSVAVAQVIPENKATYHSYYNYSAEEDEKEITNEKQEITASANTGKKTFFQRITNAAKKVNAMGVKKVDGEEENGTRSLSIGGLVLSETVSN